MSKRREIIARAFRAFARVRRLKPADVVVEMITVVLDAAGMPGLGNEHE